MENSKKTSLGLEENVEALLSYLLGWITGIVFLLIEKDNEFVKFHAMQSTITFIGFTVINIILAVLSRIPSIGIIFGLINWAIGIIAIITWIVCMVKAYQGEKYKLPIVGDLAESYTK